MDLREIFPGRACMNWFTGKSTPMIHQMDVNQQLPSLQCQLREYIPSITNAGMHHHRFWLVIELGKSIGYDFISMRHLPKVKTLRADSFHHFKYVSHQRNYHWGLFRICCLIPTLYVFSIRGASQGPLQFWMWVLQAETFRTPLGFHVLRRKNTAIRSGGSNRIQNDFCFILMYTDRKYSEPSR